MVNRIKTYINGLDEQMDGGIPEGHLCLLAGMPGSMKSSVAYNLLYHNAKENGTKGLYISLEEKRDSLIRQMTSLGMDHESVAELVDIVDLSYLRKNMDKANVEGNWVDIFKMYAQNLKKNLDYQILVIDSLRALEMLSGMEDLRLELFDLFEWLRDLGVTIFFVSEVSMDPTKVRDEDYLADGVIRLEKERVSATDTQRYLVIDKMRGTRHNTNYFALLYENNGFQVSMALNKAQF